MPSVPSIIQIAAIVSLVLPVVLAALLVRRTRSRNVDVFVEKSADEQSVSPVLKAQTQWRGSESSLFEWWTLMYYAMGLGSTGFGGNDGGCFSTRHCLCFGLTTTPIDSSTSGNQQQQQQQDYLHQTIKVDCDLCMSREWCCVRPLTCIDEDFPLFSSQCFVANCGNPTPDNLDKINDVWDARVPTCMDCAQLCGAFCNVCCAVCCCYDCSIWNLTGVENELRRGGNRTAGNDGGVVVLDRRYEEDGDNGLPTLRQVATANTQSDIARAATSMVLSAVFEF
jgi:hypothetical protein